MTRLVYFGAGLGVGVAVALLFAPQAGSETRDYLRERADQARDRLRGDTGYLTAGGNGGEPYGDGM